ncbi:hypothetical protein [Flavobacterium sp. 25HG05S-40]|uniref:hypothetical protein n=1 Tax=Flavobacterium sp. 25HG05S-40 TaxID=3458682 RepID=UPI004044BC03
MKKAFLILAVNFIVFTGFAQWTTGTYITYTTAPVVSIGSSSIQGQYGSPPSNSALEIVSPQGSGSTINLKAGAESAFLSFHSLYPSGFYLPPARTFGFFVNSISIPSLQFQPNGNVTIGKISGPTAYKLAVAGKIIAEELKVQLQAQWPDYVFTEYYKLPSLEEVEQQIKENGRLSKMPSAEEVNCEGFEVGELTRLQQEKIEELTLYIIELNKQLQAQEKRMQALEAKVNN